MLNIAILQERSKDRADRWHNTPESQWSLAEWTNALCGESGEAANLAKKIKRFDSGMRSLETNPEYIALHGKGHQQERAALVKKLKKEVADAILYGICIFNELEEDAEDTIREVFNQKSEEYGFPERI